MIPGMPPLFEGLGSHIEDYDVEQPAIGKGSFAYVYKAKCRRTQQDVAIKVIEKKKIIVDEQMAIRVRSEVHNHSRLKHPSIVELYTSFEDVQNVYLVMELCENGEMSKLIKYKYPNGMPEIHAAKYMFKITEGLLYLHSKNIFHRDCSLANLLLTKDMQCKIADFGLSACYEHGETHRTLCGTPNIISPEVAARRPHGPKSDIWALGVLLYTFLVGKAPFDGSDDAANAHCAKDAVLHTLSKVSKVNYQIPSHLSENSNDLILRLLKKEPNERITLKEMLNHPFFSCLNKDRHYGNNIHSSRISSSADTDSGVDTFSSGSKTSRYRSQSEDRSTISRKIPSPLSHQRTTTSDPSVNPIILTNNLINRQQYCDNSSQNTRILSGISHYNQSRTLSSSQSSHERTDYHENSDNKKWKSPVIGTSTPRQPGITQKLGITPLNSERLLPTRHKTKNAILTILETGEVSIEFLKKVNNIDRIHEVCRISSDGSFIDIYKPLNGQICDKPPSILDAVTKLTYKFDKLPSRHYKKYQYADKFVNLVKAKTPKLTIYTNSAKILYMENGPDPDCEVHFYKGIKVTRVDSVLRVTPKGSSSSYAGNDLPSGMEDYCEHFHKFYQRCVDLEKVLNHLQLETQCPCFPVTIGRRPQSTVLTDSPSYRGKENISGFSNTQPLMSSYSGTYSSSVMSSSTRSILRSSEQTSYPINASVRQFPDGRIVWNTNGDVTVEYTDGVTVTKTCENNGGGVFVENHKTNERFRISHNGPIPDYIPSSIREKVENLPKILSFYSLQTNYILR